MVPVQRNMTQSASVAKNEDEVALLEAMMEDSGPVASKVQSKNKEKKRASSPQAEYLIEESKAPIS